MPPMIKANELVSTFAGVNTDQEAKFLGRTVTSWSCFSGLGFFSASYIDDTAGFIVSG
jgi:hypothetical protein